MLDHIALSKISDDYLEANCKDREEKLLAMACINEIAIPLGKSPGTRRTRRIALMAIVKGLEALEHEQEARSI